MVDKGTKIGNWLDACGLLYLTEIRSCLSEKIFVNSAVLHVAWVGSPG